VIGLEYQPSPQEKPNLQIVEKALKWFDDVPFDEKTLILRTIANAPVKSERDRLYYNISQKKGQEIANYTKLIVEWCLEIQRVEEVESIGRAAGISSSSIDLLKAAYTESKKSPFREDIKELKEIPADQFKRILESIVVDSFINGNYKLSTVLRNEGISEPKLEHLRRAIFNYCTWIGTDSLEEIHLRLVDSGLDEEKAKAVVDVISKHHSELRMWLLSIRVELLWDTIMELRDSVANLQDVIRDTFDRLKDAISSLTELLRQLS
jgi:hypothetical protein